jgi:membrane protein DedA with SNARE-associated domain
MDFASLIVNYGYLVIFLGTLLEGESWVALGGFAAYQGYMHLPTLIVVAVVGAIIGDQFFFLFGRYKGKAYIQNHPKYRERVARAQGLLEKHHRLLMFGSRFMYGFRAILPIAFGISNVKQSTFIIYNSLSAVVWALIFALGGYTFGGAVEKYLGNLKRIEGYIALLVVIIILTIQFVLWYRKRKNGDNQ